ncbi:uncharacterized protein A4U43_C07F9470 [Asparagus officinalis]|uniref:Uncharacterized protein n=1 Tax=Asparagus officinalis TaxID=4686 RepID=A0A5P1EAN3_ASPOF|nr:uncharacterized protein A4U43_C07F9470 [Asparagus officinalis]
MRLHASPDLVHLPLLLSSLPLPSPSPFPPPLPHPPPRPPLPPLRLSSPPSPSYSPSPSLPRPSSAPSAKPLHRPASTSPAANAALVACTARRAASPSARSLFDAMPEARTCSPGPALTRRHVKCGQPRPPPGCIATCRGLGPPNALSRVSAALAAVRPRSGRSSSGEWVHGLTAERSRRQRSTRGGRDPSADLHVPAGAGASERSGGRCLRAGGGEGRGGVERHECTLALHGRADECFGPVP